MTVEFFIFDRLDHSKRERTPEGYLKIRDCVLARTGVQKYYAYQLGMKDRPPMQVLNIYRPPEEVFSADSVGSFNGVPITVDHPAGGVNFKNWKQVSVGEVSNVRRVGDLMLGDLLIRDADAIAKVEGGKEELSNGYGLDVEIVSGTAPDGQKYDGIQHNIAGNHVAIVDAGRCGSVCRIADSGVVENEEIEMPEQLRRVVVDGIPVEVSEAGAAVIDKLVKKLTDTETELAALKITSASDSAAKLAVKDAEIANLRKDVMTPEARDAMVAEWAGLLADSKALVPGFVGDKKTCVQIRREVIDAVCAKDEMTRSIVSAILIGKTTADASAEQLRATFEVVKRYKPVASDANYMALGQAIVGQQDPRLVNSGAHDSNAAVELKLVGRDAYLERNQNGVARK